MAMMASRRRREGAGKRARRLNAPALASELADGSSDGDGEADVERATKKWTASEQRPWHGEQASTGNGK